jgi:hypothetical protein
MCVTNLFGIPLHLLYDELHMDEDKGTDISIFEPILSLREPDSKPTSQEDSSTPLLLEPTAQKTRTWDTGYNAPRIQQRLCMLVLLLLSWNAFYVSWYVYIREI